MGVLKSVTLICIVLISLSCSQLHNPNHPVTATQTVQGQTTHFGKYLNTEGLMVNLDDLRYNSIIIVFASDSCSTCVEEARYWAYELGHILPTKILFVHYLLGGFIEDAKDWKKVFNINWNVLYSENDELYRKYCSAIITPCLLIKNNLNNILTQTYNPLRKEDLERITGPWN